jgi:predicted CXXCH cytochrome family protein
MRTLFLTLLLGLSSYAIAQENSCIDCHSDLEDELSEPVAAMEQDIHSRQGLSCVDCHGGDASSDDEDEAMYDAPDFRGVPMRDEIPAFCGRCHSDATYIRQFNPSLRVDQELLYESSLHGQLLAEGDDNVATCVSCHGNHGILPAVDPRSPVYPVNVPATCSQCHADAEYMADYGIPIDQLTKYKGSVHGRPLLEGGDISAPACNDCHGNHGAMPPGVKSLANVCGQCHPINNELVNGSPHRAAFEALGIAACKTCHNHHDIEPPSDRLVGQTEPAICVQCHSPGRRDSTIAAAGGHVDRQALERGWEGAGIIRAALDSLVELHDEASVVIDQAGRAGMEVSDALYDLHEVAGRLTRARSTVHAFNPERLTEVTAEGAELARKARQEGLDSLDELAYRRRGLALSLLVIAIVAGAVYAKIRAIDNDG